MDEGLNEKILLIFSIFSLALLIAVIINEFIAFSVKGFIQLFFGGTSIGKTLLLLFLFFLLPLILFLLKHFNLNERLPSIKAEAFLLMFIAFLIAGFYFNIFTLNFASNAFNSKGPFISLIDSNDFTGYEVSSFSHNHFPKVALYYFFDALNIHLSPKLDNGFPMSIVLPNAKVFALIFQLLSLALFFSGILFLLFKLNELSFLDFFLFFFSFLGFQVLLLDGGAYSTLILIHIFLFSFFIARNYLSEEQNTEKIFFPLAITSIYAFILGHDFSELFYGHGWALTIFFSAVLFLFFALKQLPSINKLMFSFFAIAIVFFYISTPVLINYYLNYSFGSTIEKEEHFFVFGLPKNLSESDLSNALDELFTSVEVKKLGLITLISVKPLNEKIVFRSNFLRDTLIERFNPETYVIVENYFPMKRITAIKFYFFDEMPLNIFSENQSFLDLKILSVKENANEKSITLYVEGLTEPEQQMLSVFSFLREQGFKGRAIAVRI